MKKQKLYLLSAFYTPTLKRCFVKVIDVVNDRYVLDLTLNKLDASVFSQDQIDVLKKDFVTRNEDLAYFNNEAFRNAFQNHLLSMRPMQPTVLRRFKGI